MSIQVKEHLELKLALAEQRVENIQLRAAVLGAQAREAGRVVADAAAALQEHLTELKAQEAQPAPEKVEE